MTQIERLVQEMVRPAADNPKHAVWTNPLNPWTGEKATLQVPIDPEDVQRHVYDLIKVLSEQIIRACDLRHDMKGRPLIHPDDLLGHFLRSSNFVRQDEVDGDWRDRPICL